MTFRLWPPKPPHEHATPLVFLSNEYAGNLRQAAERMRVPVLTQIPASGDFVLALSPTHSRPANIPAHIPTIDASSPDITRLLEAALLYLEAHHRIKK